MRITVDIPAPLFRQAKAEAAHRGVKLKELLIGALEKEIADEAAHLVRRVRFPLVKAGGKRTIRPTRKDLDESLWD